MEQRVPNQRGAIQSGQTVSGHPRQGNAHAVRWQCLPEQLQRWLQRQRRVHGSRRRRTLRRTGHQRPSARSGHHVRGKRALPYGGRRHSARDQYVQRRVFRCLHHDHCDSPNSRVTVTVHIVPGCAAVTLVVVNTAFENGGSSIFSQVAGFEVTSSPYGGVTVSGHVTDASSGLAIGGAAVSALGSDLQAPTRRVPSRCRASPRVRITFWFRHQATRSRMS